MFKERSMAYFERCLSEDNQKLRLDVAVETYGFCSGITAEKLVVAVPTVDVAAEALGD